MKIFNFSKLRVNSPHFEKRLFSRFPLAEEREIENIVKSSRLRGFYYREDLQYRETAILLSVDSPDYGRIWILSYLKGDVLELRTVFPKKEGGIPSFYSAYDEWRRERGENPPLKENPVDCEVQFTG